MKNCLLRIGLPLGVALISSYPGEAQQVVNYGRGPALSHLTAPGIDSGSVYKFAPTNGFDCPTPSFSVGGFGAGGNDWANDFTAYRSAGSGVNNFGVAAALRVPLGGESARYCKEYAKALKERAEIEMAGIRRNDQLSLLVQCNWLLENKINVDQKIFKDKGALSALNACNDYNPDPLPSAEMREPSKPLTRELVPPLTQVEPNPPPNQILRDR